MVIVIFVMVKFSNRWFIGVFMDLFKSIMRIIIVLLIRFIRIMIEKVVIRLMFIIGDRWKFERL